ncbi:MAG TPA: four helix bundle protein [Candidatus Paceibacterota bacterium]
MSELNSHNQKTTPPHAILPVLGKLKDTYLLWHQYHNLLPKTQKYSLGNRVDTLFIESIEAISTAAFLPKGEKTPWVRLAIRKMDTVKILVMILWETKSLDNKKYITLSEKVDEVGKQLGGWNGQLQKQNSADNKSAEK